MGHKLTIQNAKNVQNTYWSGSQQYSQSIINNIIDPAGGNINKLLTAIPSPFARMHMFETAFDMALKNIGKNQNTVFEKLVSECFDMFELLYNLALHKSAGHTISIAMWNFEHHINNLISSTDSAHQQLGEVLRKYVVNNSSLNSNPNIYLFNVNDKVFGGTSPFTGFFTKADLVDFEIRKDDGNTYFSKVAPIWSRDPNFILAIYKTFSLQNGQIAREASSVFKYLTNNLVVNKIVNPPLNLQVKKIIKNEPDGSLPDFNSLVDDQGALLTICNSLIFVQNSVSPNMGNSPLALQIPQNWKNPSYLTGIPLVLRDGEDHLGTKNSGIKVPKNAGPIGGINERILPGNGIKYPYLVTDDFLEDQLIELRYPVNDNSFIIPNYTGINKEEDNGFLLPIKKEYFDFFDEATLQRNLSIKKLNNGYQVELKIPIQGNEPVILKKFYYSNSLDTTAGKLVTNSNIYMSFFPLFKVVDGGKIFNDFYKIMLVDDEPTKEYVELKVFDENNTEIALNAGAQKSISKGIRVAKTPDNGGGSIYYTTNFPLRFIEVNIPENDLSINKMKGLIIPKWREIPLGNRSYDIAVDFGTTNTNVSLLEYRGTQNTKPETLKIGRNDLQTVLFNKSNQDPNNSLSDQYEKGNNFVTRHLIPRLIHEFVPSIIGEETKWPKYQFPMRTAISSPNNGRTGNLNLFENVNISFSCEKEQRRPDEDIITNLKWNIGNTQISALVAKFIEELLYIVRNKILLTGGDPRLCKMIWFKPLSMYLNDQVIYGQIWVNALNGIFKIDDTNGRIFALTESCAPFYYYAQMSRANSKNPVLSLDIGGGSTDVSFFINGEPQFGTSFNFAGNSLWHPGLVKKQQQKIGIVQYYGNTFIESLINKHRNDRTITKAIDLILHNSNSGGLSEDIFNLYFTWDHLLGFSNTLSSDPKVKFLILFHFSSIIYFCTKLLCEKGLCKPQFICISGNGSKYLSIIDPSDGLKLLNGFLDSFVTKISTGNSKYKVTLEQVMNKKEATSIGGLYLLADSRAQGTLPKDTQETVPYYGEESPKFESLLYSEISNSLQDGVVNNVNNFLDIFFAMDKSYSFNRNLGIRLPKDFEFYKGIIKENTLQYLDAGLADRKLKSRNSEHVNEPLFFYPLVSMLFDLGKLLYDGEDDEN